MKMCLESRYLKVIDALSYLAAAECIFAECPEGIFFLFSWEIIIMDVKIFHLLEGARKAKGLTVIIDVFRAFSTACYAFDMGVKKSFPVGHIELAYRLKEMNNELVLMGERNEQKPEGFDFGNSPYSYMKEEVKGKEIVLTTTNGTKALNIAKDAETVVVASLLNLDAVCQWLEKQDKNILCLCSGWQDKFNLEDTICAGAISEYLLGTGKFTSDEDSSIAAKYLYLSAWVNPLGYLKSSSHRRRLKNLNLNEDIKYCLTPNQTNVIPILKDGKLVKL